MIELFFSCKCSFPQAKVDVKKTSLKGAKSERFYFIFQTSSERLKLTFRGPLLIFFLDYPEFLTWKQIE